MSEVIWYHSEEVGVPVLNNAAGSLIAVLDACLVNGFNSNSCNIAVASGVATVTAAAHGYEVGKKVLIEGATPAALNGVKKVISAAVNTFTFAAAGVSDGPATGLISCKRAPLGWAIAHTGANKRIYARTLVSASPNLLYVDDTTVAPASLQSARAYGLESATDISTHGPRFPANTDVNGGLWWTKGASSVTAKHWTLVGDGRIFFLSIGNGNTTVLPSGAYVRGMYVFGDIDSFKAGDAYPTIISGDRSDVSNQGGTLISNPTLAALPGSTFTPSCYIARTHTQIGAAKGLNFSGNTGGVGLGNGDTNLPRADALIDGVVRFRQPVWVLEAGPANNTSTLCFRGVLPGIVEPLFHNKPTAAPGYFADREIVSDAVGSSREFLCVRCGAAGAAEGLLMFDITGPW